MFGRLPPHRSERETVLHSWAVQAEWNAPTVVGGCGARFETSDGRSLLDFSSQSECCNLGHQHPAVIAAIKAQADRLCYVSNAWGAEPRARLAELLLEKSGFVDGRVFFTLGGADANEHAVKFARQVSAPGQGLVITRDRSYHGASYATMATRSRGMAVRPTARSLSAAMASKIKTSSVMMATKILKTAVTLAAP